MPHSLLGHCGDSLLIITRALFILTRNAKNIPLILIIVPSHAMEHDDFSNNCENNTRFTMRDLKMNLQSNADFPSVDFSWHPPKIISHGFGDQGVGCNKKRCAPRFL